MSRILKKVITILLTLSIIATSQGVIAFAEMKINASVNENAYTTTAKSENSFYTNSQLLNNLGINVNNTLALKQSSNSTTIYCIDNDTTVEILENSNERIQIKITEGTKTDNIVFTNDGLSYLDGHQVIVTDSTGNEVLHELFAEPRSGYSIYYQRTCPSGSGSDYTHYYGQEKSANINLGKDITDLSVVAFRSFMLTYLGVAGQLASDILDQFYSILLTTEPTTSALSYKADMYSHQSYQSGYIPSIFTFVWKYNLKLYSKTNYTGAVKTENVYKCKLTV